MPATSKIAARYGKAVPCKDTALFFVLPFLVFAHFEYKRRKEEAIMFKNASDLYIYLVNASVGSSMYCNILPECVMFPVNAQGLHKKIEGCKIDEP